jgi:hypothetical protein
MSPETVRDKMIHFLMYNKIIKPEWLSTAVSAASIQKNMEVPKVRPIEGHEREGTRSIPTEKEKK